MKKYIDMIKKSNPELFEHEMLKEDSIFFAEGLKVLREHLISGGFTVIGYYPRKAKDIDSIMDFCLQWNGPDYYIAYKTKDYISIEPLEEFLKTNF